MRASEVPETITGSQPGWRRIFSLNDAILLDAVFKMRGEVLPLITAQFHGEALAFEQLVEHRFFLAQFFQRLGKGRTVNCCGNAPFGDIHGDRLLR